ncbi:MAG: hypothetical protein JO314_11500 [Acidobacteria bacterium]|nr:hypothetical protein [Acidobacteriota bacterium]
MSKNRRNAGLTLFLAGTHEVAHSQQNTGCTPGIGNPCIHDPTMSGTNHVPNQPNREGVSDVGHLGFKETGSGGHILLNVESEFAPGDKIDDYKTLRTVVLNGGEVRSGDAENPDRSQTAIEGNSKFVTDSPGRDSTGAKAGIKNEKVVMAFATGEYNTKTGKLGSNVGYYEVVLTYDNKGGIDKSNSGIIPLSKEKFSELVKKVGVSVPKDKSGQPDPSRLLSRH